MKLTIRYPLLIDEQENALDEALSKYIATLCGPVLFKFGCKLLIRMY